MLAKYILFLEQNLTSYKVAADCQVDSSFSEQWSTFSKSVKLACGL